MSHLRLTETLLLLLAIGGLACPGAASDLGVSRVLAPSKADSPHLYMAQTAGTTPQILAPKLNLGDNALVLELTSKYGITGTELKILADELQSGLLTKETINRYQIGADAAQYASICEAIYSDAALVDFDKDGKADWKLDSKLNKRDVFTGFHGAVYIHRSRKEVVIAFEGTKFPDPSDLTSLHQTAVDLLNDITGAVFSDPQTVRAEPLVQETLAKYGKDHAILVTGHSLGGRLAQIVAASMSLKAYTFNPAAVSKVTQYATGPANPSNITNIFMVSDIINPLSKLTPTKKSLIGSDLGQRVEFYFARTSLLGEHSISTVAQRLSGVRQVYEDKINPILATGKVNRGGVASVTKSGTITHAASNQEPPPSIDRKNPGTTGTGLNQAQSVSRPGLSGDAVAKALGPTKEHDRAAAIAQMVKQGAIRLPLAANELAAILKGITGSNRSYAIAQLAALIKSRLTAPEAATVLGTGNELREHDRAAAIQSIAKANSYAELAGDAALILEGTTGGNRRFAIAEMAIFFKRGLSASAVSEALGSVQQLREHDRAVAIQTLVRASVPGPWGGEASEPLNSITGSNRSFAIAQLAPRLRANLTGMEVSSILGPPETLREHGRAEAINSLVKAKRLRMPFSGDELGLVLTGTTGANRSYAIGLLTTHGR